MMFRCTRATALAVTVILMTVACGAPEGQGAVGGPDPKPETPTAASNTAERSPTQVTINATPTSLATVLPTQAASALPEAKETGDTPVTNPQQTRAVDAARRELARAARTDADDAALVTISAQEWPDTALGCPQPGMMYQQVITLGYLVLLNARGKTYRVHTDTSGRAVVCENGADGPRAPEQAPLFTVTRSGGFAGLTSTLVVWRDGTSKLHNNASSPKSVSNEKLRPGQLRQLKEALASREWKTLSTDEDQPHADGYQYNIVAGEVVLTTHDGADNPRILDVVLSLISGLWSNPTQSR